MRSRFDVAIAYGPIESWPGPLTKNRQSPRFDADYDTTIRELKYELHRIRVYEARILVAVRADQIRLDGQVRANTKPEHPGAILVFEHPKVGLVQYATDRYENRRRGNLAYADNVRAIVKTLEALRAVDRHGASHGGAQYRGYAALPAPMPMSGPATHMTRDEAAEILAAWSEYKVEDILADLPTRKHAIRRARAAVHPDVHDKTEDWDTVQIAIEVIDR